MALEFQLVRNKVRWLTTITFVVSGIVSATWASRIPDMQKIFGLSESAWGTVLASLYAGLMFGLPISSLLLARFDGARMTVISSIIHATVLALLPWAPNVATLVFLLFLFGMSRNLLNLSINTNSIGVQKLYKHSIITTFHGAWSLACLSAAGIGTLMIALEVKVNWHFLLLSLAGILLILVLRLKSRKNNDQVAAKRVFRWPDKYLLVFGLLAFCAMTCEGAIYDWGVNYFSTSVGVQKELSTAGYMGYLVSMTVGRLTGDKLISAIGRQRLIVINGLLMFSGFLLAALFPQFLPSLFAFVLIGLGNSAMVPIVYYQASRSELLPTASAIAMVTLIGYFGFLLGPILIGNLSEHLSMRATFGMISILGLCVSLIAVWFRRYFDES